MCGISDIQTSPFQIEGPLKPPTFLDAINALSSFEIVFNNFCSLALDLTAINRDDFNIAQTQSSVDYIGSVTRSQPNSSYQCLVPGSHLINLARSALHCTRLPPSQSVTFPSRVILLAGETF